MFTDHMVLQREIECPMSGSVDPSAKVEAFIDGRSVATATADAAGVFKLRLPALREPGPYKIEIRSGSDVAVLNDVLAGEVWLCSGQSNMEWPLSKAVNGPQEVAEAKHPHVRLYHVPHVGAGAPLKEIKATWEVCTPATAGRFSAVAYFFARQVNKELNVPIGIIHSSWGGTPAESWTPLPKLKQLTALPLVSAMAANVEASQLPDAAERFDAALLQWMQATNHVDVGVSDEAKAWSRPDFDAADWKPMTMPTDVTRHGVPSGSVTWYRKEIDVPAEQAGKPLTLTLGNIDHFDTTFFNGERVGTTDRTSPRWWATPRRYVVPGGMVKAGPNLIAIRNVHLDGPAGLTGPAAVMRATLSGPASRPATTTTTTAPATTRAATQPAFVPLTGTWQHRIERVYTAPTGPQPPRPLPPYNLESAWTPSALYNGMIAPIGDYAIRGALWYQGESNAVRHAEYEALLAAMIGSWREQFGVGLANFREATNDPNLESTWAHLREAQRQVGLKVKNAAVSTTIDIGQANDIHPTNKQDVGRRLALIALEETYGKQLVSRGPTLRSASFDGPQVTLAFDYVGAGLEIRGDAQAFSVAGTDGKFAWAKARVEGDRIIVSSPAVPAPVTVRYAFADNPPATLFNSDGLPAEPFTAPK
jgi:sialate O-acetylesterase